MSWDPVHDSRETFLAVLGAQCDPGAPTGPLPAADVAADPDVDTAAAVLLSLLDADLVVAVADGGAVAAGSGTAEPGTAGALLEMVDAVCRLTGAGLGTVEEADVVLVTGDPVDAITSAQPGTPLAPERGATVIVVGGTGETLVDLTGPGVPGVRTVTLPLPSAALAALDTVNAAYPCGVDLLVVTGRHLVAVPRSVTARHWQGQEVSA